MGYKDVSNDGKYAKVKRVQGDDEDALTDAPTEGQVAAPPAQDSTGPSLADIMGALTILQQNFESFRGEVTSHLDSIDTRLDLINGFPQFSTSPQPSLPPAFTIDPLASPIPSSKATPEHPSLI